MRRLIFIIVMMFFIWLLFYGQPAYVSWLRAQQGDGEKSAAVVVDTAEPSLVAQYKIEQRQRAAGKYATPQQVLQAYSMALIKHKMPYQRDLFTLETQLMLPRLNVNTAQMNSEALLIEQCLPGAVFENAAFAVIRFALERRACPPYFLERQEQGWRIDLLTLRNNVSFNAQNQWRFIDAELMRSGAYGFAFDDVDFDKSGYPYHAAP
tara:strand:+ start:467 stop:1090 length:624 start_codon:yes stop_codon:yes gene_type:complete